MSELAPAIDPGRALLLVMDYQPAALDRLPGAEEGLLSRLAAALGVARSAGVSIGYVRVALDDADYDAVPDTNKGFAAMATARRLRSGAPETAVHPAVAPRPGDLCVRKTRVGAFSTTDLDRQLRERRIDTLSSPASAPAGSCSRPCVTPPIAITACTCSKTPVPIATRGCTTCSPKGSSPARPGS